MPNDNRGPEAMADAMRRFLAQSGFAGRVEQATVLEAWPAIVGPAVAAVTVPQSVAADGTLFVAVRSAAWMAELSMMEREILAAIRRTHESAGIARIRWMIAR
jgi:predicted nucleic acid-binding Zn ribbon protein